MEHWSLWQVILCCVVAVLTYTALDFVFLFIKKRKFQSDDSIREQGHKVYLNMSKHGCFEGPPGYRYRQEDSVKENPYPQEDRRHRLWAEGFMKDGV